MSVALVENVVIVNKRLLSSHDTTLKNIVDIVVDIVVEIGFDVIVVVFDIALVDGAAAFVVFVTSDVNVFFSAAACVIVVVFFAIVAVVFTTIVLINNNTYHVYINQ